MSKNDDDLPQLSAETYAALQEFYQTQTEKERNENRIEENWQLSQFWYDTRTVDVLANIALKTVAPSGTIALVSCPSLYTKLKEGNAANEVTVFEYDRRFATKFGDDFVYYDYNAPLNVPEERKHYYDLVVADPPFLSEECLRKTAETIKFLGKRNVILCTGSIMGELARRLLDVERRKFQPRHANNLANEFCCFSNYDIDDML